MSSADDGDLDHILRGSVSDKLVAITKSPQLTMRLLTNLLGVVLAPTNDAGSTAELLPREGKTVELQRGGPCKEPCLPFADALPWPHLCLISHVKNAGILSTPAKVKY